MFNLSAKLIYFKFPFVNYEQTERYMYISSEKVNKNVRSNDFKTTQKLIWFDL